MHFLRPFSRVIQLHGARWYEQFPRLWTQINLHAATANPMDVAEALLVHVVENDRLAASKAVAIFLITMTKWLDNHAAYASLLRGPHRQFLTDDAAEALMNDAHDAFAFGSLVFALDGHVLH